MMQVPMMSQNNRREIDWNSKEKTYVAESPHTFRWILVGYLVSFLLFINLIHDIVTGNVNSRCFHISGVFRLPSDYASGRQSSCLISRQVRSTKNTAADCSIDPGDDTAVLVFTGHF